MQSTCQHWIIRPASKVYELISLKSSSSRSAKRPARLVTHKPTLEIDEATVLRRNKTISCSISIIAMSLTLWPGADVNADDEHLGIAEFEIACMPCHGLEGRGDGPLARTLKVVPADLTQIAKSNQGRFPAKKVSEIIDGRATVAAHGARDMPVWGDRYRVATEAGENPKEVELRARAQIDALVQYLEGIQEQ